MILQIATALAIGIYVVLSKDGQSHATPQVSFPRTGHSPGVSDHSPNIA
jgi:hypothetical protein